MAEGGARKKRKKKNMKQREKEKKNREKLYLDENAPDVDDIWLVGEVRLIS